MAPATKKQWTVMVYLAGDNNLDSCGVADLGEMKKVGSTDQINIIAEFDRRGTARTTKRFYLRKGTTLAKDAVADLGETNMGDPAVLTSFLNWGFKAYPAHHYLVVVWNHGNGWNDEDVYRIAKRQLRLTPTRRPARSDPGAVSLRRVRVISGEHFHRGLFRTGITSGLRQRGIAYDDNAKDFLDNVEMKKVVMAAAAQLGAKIDILGMDACLMSMAEVGYQLRDGVALTVGSEQTEPGDGWPYDTILGDLAKKPTMTPQALATTVVRRYLASYPANAGVTQAACDLSKSAVMAGAVDALGKALTSGMTVAAARAGILQARFQVQSYEDPDYVDLINLCDLIHTNCSQAAIQSACNQVISSVGKGGFVIESGCKGNDVAHSNGLSIYFPQKKLSGLYGTLDFVKQTSWGDFLKTFVSAASPS